MKIFPGNYERRPFAAVAFSMLALLAGCAMHHAYLVPAPNASLANGGQAAQASADDISITVTPNAWQGTPHDLDKRVTPLNVRIENHSKNPIRLTYGDFDLKTPQGNTLAALPPSEITGQYVGENQRPVVPHLVLAAWQDKDSDHHDEDHDRHHRGHRGPRVVIAPGFAYSDFYYAPYWDYGYVGLGPWPYAWGPDWGYYGTYYPEMRMIHLPTRSMLEKAIPEGVIAAGGYVQGFLYFTKLSPDLQTVQFIAKLQHAKDGQQFGTIEIPFEVKRM